MCEKIRHEGAFTIKWLWSHQLETLINILLLPQKFISFIKVSLEKEKKKKPTWELPLPTFLLIHMKLMLFTDFLQTHQSNLHPSDRFPLLNFTKKYLEVMQTPAITTGSKQGCEISEKQKSSKIFQSTPPWIPDKEHACEHLNER